ncbi:tetratricopeptide repeat protein 23 [Gracilinanus agilis]|uniref:tetratricopeptide repeat protein 23 n=1 Tax=Gracilinanus agilis TaxID=191870 RepID=UPI001CFDDEB3|nr:tetratricopeptide repeat protein 23 [Gracilinanus agilis]
MGNGGRYGYWGRGRLSERPGRVGSRRDETWKWLFPVSPGGGQGSVGVSREPGPAGTQSPRSFGKQPRQAGAEAACRSEEKEDEDEEEILTSTPGRSPRPRALPEKRHSSPWLAEGGGEGEGAEPLYQIQMKSEEALAYYEESLRYTKISKGKKSPECIPILKEMATVEQILGNYDSAIDHLIQAHHIIQKQHFSVEEKTNSALSVAHAAIASSKAEHNDVADQYFQKGMTILKEAKGITNDKYFAIQDEFCHFLRNTGNQKRATQILKESLGAKVATFGNISPEVAGTYCLLGEADLAQGDQNMAYKKFKKCLQIQTFLYGSQDKRTTATQQTLDSLTKIIEVTAKQKPNNKARPPFCAVIPQHSILGRTKRNICD